MFNPPRTAVLLVALAAVSARPVDAQPAAPAVTLTVPVPPVSPADVMPSPPPTISAGEGVFQAQGGGNVTSTPRADTTPRGGGTGGGGGPAGEGGKGKPEPPAGWDNGFFIRSADKNFQFRITGQVQADYRNFLDDGDRVDIDGFVVRRARFGLEATLYKYYEFRFLPDFGVGQPRITDAFLNVRYWDEFQVTAGKFKQPFSYEQLIQDRFTPLMERSLIDQFVPVCGVGVGVQGQYVFGCRLDYGVGLANGIRDGDADTNDQKDVTARVAVRPFANEEGAFLRRLQVGVSVGTGIEGEAVNPQTLRTPASVPFFTFNRGVLAAGHRNRISPETAYFYTGLGFSAQYFLMDQRFRPAAVGPGAGVLVDVPFEGFYVQASYLLTGEERTGYSQAVDPLRPFDPRAGFRAAPGAWEVVARVSRMALGDAVFAPGDARLADPLAVSNDATEMTLGFNSYLNRLVRLQMNWEHAWFGRPVRLGPGPEGLLRTHDAVQARVQIIF